MRQRSKLAVLAVLVMAIFVGRAAWAAEPAAAWADIVVIGAGSAGIAAAAEAAGQGVKVIVLEKMGTVGGSYMASGGQMAFAGTDMQEQRNIKDSRELLYADLMGLGQNVNDPGLIQAYVDNQLDTYYWLKKAGVKFTEVEDAMGMSVPRSHVADSSETIKVLYDMAVRNGATVLTGVTARRLISDRETGKVTGVLAEQDGKERVYKAKRGIILASGGFAANRELLEKLTVKGGKSKARFAPGLKVKALRDLCPKGADCEDKPQVKETFGLYSQGKRADNLVLTFYRGGIVVNKNGKRFVNESLPFKQIGDAALEQPDAVVFQVYDAPLRDVVKGKISPPAADLQKKGFLYEGATVAELAAKIGVPAEALANTVKEYNEAVDKGVDPQFGRTTLVGSLGKPVKIETPPFYAAPSVPVLFGSYGGIVIDGKARVLDAANKPIPGLFAAGEVTSGSQGVAYMSGNAFGKAFVFGRIAARTALSGK